jgi:hypothetical protein
MRVYRGQAFVRIKTLRHVWVGCIMITWVETPSTPPFIGEGGRVYMGDLVCYGST